MTIAFACSCGKSFKVPDSAAGKRAKCAGCGQILVVPQPPPPTPTPSPTPAVPNEDDAFRMLAEESEPAPRPGLQAEYEPEPPSRPDPTSRPAPKSRSAPPSRLNEPRTRPTEINEEEARRQMAARYKDLPEEKPAISFANYSYWLLILCFIPLTISLLQTNRSDTFERLMHSIEKAYPPVDEKPTPQTKGKVRQKTASNPGRNTPAIQQPQMPEISLEEMIDRLPGGKIEGALLARNSHMHWIFALLSGCLFLGATFTLFQIPGKRLHVLYVFLFTATVGVILLLVAQFLAEATQGYFLLKAHPVVMLIYWIAWAIGFSYRAAMDPDIGFVPSLLGFTFGVGYCEEVCKFLPVLFFFRMYGYLPWRTACAWGFASGIGFGVSEGIMYSSDHYNGLSTYDIYLVRFLSCVALHGIWAASSALFAHKFKDLIREDFSWYDYIPRALFMVSIPMIPHGLYNTFLKHDMELYALAIAFVSFTWFAWCFEKARRRGDEPQKSSRRR